jgi:hypothetical protein
MILDSMVRAFSAFCFLGRLPAKAARYGQSLPGDLTLAEPGMRKTIAHWQHN